MKDIFNLKTSFRFQHRNLVNRQKERKEIEKKIFEKYSKFLNEYLKDKNMLDVSNYAYQDLFDKLGFVDEGYIYFNIPSYKISQSFLFNNTKEFILSSGYFLHYSKDKEEFLNSQNFGLLPNPLIIDDNNEYNISSALLSFNFL